MAVMETYFSVVRLAFCLSFGQPHAQLHNCQDLNTSLSSSKSELSEEVERHYTALQEAGDQVQM